MSITKTNIFNFKSESDCDEYISNHRAFFKSLKKEDGLQEIHWVRATADSLLTFTIIESEEHGTLIQNKAKEWREKNDFNIHDMLVFDGDLVDSFRT